jgi:predicted ATP-dependent endonuclease of OLD family
MTALIGKNDAGKSSVMDALDIFLNDGAPDKHDASKGGDGKNLAITCEFSHLPQRVVLDEESETTFEEEYLLNAAGNFEISKTYSGHLTRRSRNQKGDCQKVGFFNNLCNVLIRQRNTGLLKIFSTFCTRFHE